MDIHNHDNGVSHTRIYLYIYYIVVTPIHRAIHSPQTNQSTHAHVPGRIFETWVDTHHHRYHHQRSPLDYNTVVSANKQTMCVLEEFVKCVDRC